MRLTCLVALVVATASFAPALRPRVQRLDLQVIKRRLVYVSCGFDALQRDLAALAAGRWRLDRVEGHVLFPGADHVETLAVLDEGE